MAIQICFLPIEIENKIIRNTLSKLYNVAEEEIHDLLDFESQAKICYQLTKLDETSDFRLQLEIFPTVKIIKTSEIYNNLILAQRLQKHLKLNILIDDESDNPYQWLLLRNQKLYLTEEIYNDQTEGVSLEKDEIELNIAKANKMLPQLQDFLSKKITEPYFVKNSKAWLACQLF